MFSKAKSLLSAVAGRTINPEEANPLFSFTSGRWLCNNDAQIKARYARFNVDGLKRVASRTTGSKVQSLTKLSESLNRVFLLTYENGQQNIARIPTPICGPPHFTTASEVATMDLLRRLGLPVPAVLAWSSRAGATEVEAEFILMEKAPGVPLVEIWDTVDHVDLVHKLAKLHRPLLDLSFTVYGSLYYKGDVDAPHRSIDDFVEGAPPGVDLSPFCMGPLARRDFWQDARATMDIGRGPWVSALDYMNDVAMREQTWIDRHAAPHMHDDFLCGLPLQGKLDDHIEYLEYYKHTIPYIIPTASQHTHGHLWHPDLHAANLFVSPSGAKTDDASTPVEITSLIDWQGAWVGPAFLQLAAPVMFRTPGVGAEALALPPHLASLDPATQAQLALPHIMNLPALAARRELESLAQQTWRTGLLPFRRALITVCKQWADIAPGQDCPIEFTPAACAEHDAAYAYWSGHRARAEALDEEFSLGEFGYVTGDLARFEKIQKQLDARRKEWVASGVTPEGRLIKEILWPYRDTLADNPRSHLLVDVSTLSASPLHDSA